MITIKYDAYNGGSFADGRCWEVLDACVKDDKDSVIHTSTANIVHALRLLVKRGTVKHTDVIMLYHRPDGVTLQLVVDNNGRIDSWPDGFCDFEEKIYEELIEWQD